MRQGNDEMFYINLLLTLVVACTARPSDDFKVRYVLRPSPDEDSPVTAASLYVITVPTNCPPGQKFINGECRDIWKRSVHEDPSLRVTSAPRNVITVPTNCPPGQELINGQCRDIWRISNEEELAFAVTPAPMNVITVPANCPPGQQLINGECRDVWPKDNSKSKSLAKIMDALKRSFASEQASSDAEEAANAEEILSKRVISVPYLKCPEGSAPDQLGRCRKIFSPSNGLV